MNKELHGISENLKETLENFGINAGTTDSGFYYVFIDEEKSEQHTYGFVVNSRVAKSFEDMVEFELFGELTANIESVYGIHDWTSSPTDNPNAIAFTSYEVDPNRYKQLMTVWREQLVYVFGEDNIGEVVYYGVE